MSFIKLSRRLPVCCLFSLCCLNGVFADTIYQWTDPWGQIKYSKTQVPGSMISNLTKLPKLQKITEQQKQDAMLQKMQEMKNAGILLREKNNKKKLLKQQIIRNDNHCRKLRNLLSDVKLRNTKKYYQDNYYSRPGEPFYQGRYYFSGRFNYYSDDYLENDLYWEIREYCR